MRRLLTLNFTLLIVLLSFSCAEAALNLSVSPVTGGNSIRFGRIGKNEEVNREVRIRITSTDATQYQVFQRLADPFSNDRNATLSRDVLEAYTLLGSNGSGTLYAQALEPVGFSDQLLYSSSPAGDNDNFTVAYMIRGQAVTASGKFFGRVQYTLRPISGASQDDVILNVTFEASDDLKIEIEGSSTPESVRLKLKNDQDREGYVRFTFRENSGQDIRFSQDIDVLPQDEFLKEIDPGAILFSTAGSAKGEMYPVAPLPLSRRVEQVYRSQEGEDTFYVNFLLDQDTIEQQGAGTYRGKLKYVVESGETRQQAVIDLEVEVDPVFAMKVDLPPEGLSFERLLPDSPPLLRDVSVEVRSNSGRPYMVMQNFASPLMNETGDEIPEEYFTVKVELQKGQAGKPQFSNFKAVPSEDHQVFISDNAGSPSRFKVVYRLRSFTGMVPGSYSTAVRFSLGEI